MWARRAIRFIHKKRNRCCDAAAKFFFTISLVCCCCCCRKHTAHSLWKNTQPPNQRSPPISVEMSLVRWFPTLLDESTLATFFKEKTKRRRRTLKKRKCWKKFFFISHFWTEKKTFWRSVVNLCFDTFFFLFYYFPFFSLKKKEKNGCSSENDKLMAATVKDRKNTHGHGSFPDVQSAKPNFFLCVSRWMKMSSFPQS